MIPKLHARYRNDRDGFVGVVIGSYVTLEGEHGLVLQQVGTKVVHVYRLKWLTPDEGTQES